MTRLKALLLFCLLLFCLLLVGVVSTQRCRAADMPTLTVLHTFGAGGSGRMTPSEDRNSDGARPEAPLTQGRDGALYGSTSSGGTHGTGVIFKVNPNGTGFTILHAFGPLAALFVNKTNSDGAWPKGALVHGSDGLLYGASEQGGPRGGGTLFRMNPDGTAFQVLHAFGPTSELSRNGDGAWPVGLTLGSDGLLYGVTTLGGESGNGLIFRIGPDGKGFKVLRAFREVTYGNNVNDEGARPGAALVFGRDGALYGTTNIGGRYGYGLAFKCGPDGKGFAVLHHFQRKGAGFEANGVFPDGPLTLGPDGFFYGSARQGGAYDGGVLFRMSADGHIFTILHTFSDSQSDNADGTLPSGAPVFGGDSRLYGVASVGGANGMGTFYQIKADGSHFAVRHDFGPSQIQQSTEEGSFPTGGLLLGHDGAFYGITGGGTHGTGTVFRFTLPPAK